MSQPIVDCALFEQQQESPICDATHYRNSYCPKYIRIAQREWNRLVGELCALRMLTNLDRAVLAAYCGAYALWAEAMEAIQKYGPWSSRAIRISDSVALRRDRQSAGRDHDADCVGVRLHAGEPEPDRNALHGRANAVRCAGRISGRAGNLSTGTPSFWED